ncbi:MAG: phage major capsid protein [Vicinamibacterales bacterium]
MKLSEQKTALASLLVELKAAEKELDVGVTQTRGEEIDAKFAEADSLQKEIDRADRVFSFNGKSREIPEVVMPETKDSNAGEMGADGSRIVGYAPMGALFTNSPEYKEYVANGMGRGTMAQVNFLKGLNEPHIAITQKMVEQKAVPTVGSGVILVDRKPGIVRTTEDDRTVLRDVINVSQTSAPSVSYIVEDSYTQAADMVAASAVKPEATVAYSEATAPVRTLAVHMPVTEQQLQDIPQMQNMIDNRLRYDLRKLEEKQIMWGAGTGQNFLGILVHASVASITRSAPAATQNLDRVRIGVTDVLVAGYEPNALVIHPYDWEAIVLLKATTEGYIWSIVTDPATGNSRVWGLSVVESIAAKNPAASTRDMVVGDFRRGATLWDRQQATVAVGFIDDQFIRNMRTIRAEERAAFGVQAPKAFAKYETAA